MPSKRYVLGIRCGSFVNRCLGSISTGEILAPIVRDLAEAAQESAAFAQPKGNGFFFSAKHEMPSSYHHLYLYVINTRIAVNGYGILSAAFSKTSKDNSEFRAAVLNQGYYISREEKGTRVIKPVFFSDEGYTQFAGVIGITTIARTDPSGEIINQVIQHGALAKNLLVKKLKFGDSNEKTS
ncbi:MAG: hypothetical protein ACLFST_14280 [Spirochaetia bacterium]